MQARTSAPIMRLSCNGTVLFERPITEIASTQYRFGPIDFCHYAPQYPAIRLQLIPEPSRLADLLATLEGILATQTIGQWEAEISLLPTASHFVGLLVAIRPTPEGEISLTIVTDTVAIGSPRKRNANQENE